MSPAPGLLDRWAQSLHVPSWVTPPVVVGCSGGADSLALLALAAGIGLDPVAVHVDHGLRPGSAAEAALVEAAASSLGARFAATAVTVPPGPGMEAAARDARLAALEDARRERGASAVLVGHTRDDQAETVLLNLLRGAAAPGLGGIPPERRLPPVVHPMLELTRADTVEICARLGFAPLADPMNLDTAFRRVWLRREVIPLLEGGAHRDLRAVLARQASVLRHESELLDTLADQELARLGAVPGGPLPAEVAHQPLALARRVVRRWLAATPPPRMADVDAVLAVASGSAAATELPGGVRVERSGGLLHATATGPGAAGEWIVPVPGSAPAGDLLLETWVERAPPVHWPDGRWTCVLDADAVGDHLVVRAAQPGDRLVPLGMEGAKTVAAILSEAGVPPARRRDHPVALSQSGQPVWVLGYRVGALARVTAGTKRYLWASAGGRA